MLKGRATEFEALLGRQGGARRFCRAVRFADHAASPDGTIFPESMSEILSCRSPVPKPSIIRPPQIFGKEMSVIPIHGLTAMGWPAPTHT
jgi:hypothetical protein